MIVRAIVLALLHALPIYRRQSKRPLLQHVAGFQMEGTSAASNIERIESTHDGEEEEILKFQSLCSNCLQAADLVVQRATIPHFQEVVLMCMLCDHCGFKTTEIKDSWSMPIPTHETKITLLVQRVEDFCRDIVLSSSAAISIPELELEQQEGGFEGMYTTVEGLLKKMLAD
jgi:zinc finger protein